MLNHRSTGMGIVLIAFAVSILSLCACGGRNEMGNQVIVQNESFVLTGDSVIEDTVFACAPSVDRIRTNITLGRLDSIYGRLNPERVKFVHGRPWQMRQPRPALFPDYESDQPLVDALYNMSVDYIADAIDGSGCFKVSQNNYSRLYCSIFLSLAALKPQQSMSTLRAMVDRDSIIMQREGQWPVVSDHIGWATAAWEVYKVTGDSLWLAYSQRVIEKTLAINRKILFDQNTGLVHGAGYTTAKPLGERRMTWMGYNDLFACMALGNNILTSFAYAILAEMSDALEIENTYLEDAIHLKDAINQHLWNEDKDLYSSFLYGIAYPRQSPLTDNTSQAMCVLWDIADDDRAENLIAHTPVSDQGVNVTYPASIAIEPYFTNSSWATTQALWNLAAVAVGNENALRRGLGALYRAQALFQSHGIHIKDIDTDQLGTGASNAAMVLKVLAGMHFTPEGIEFAPMVPAGMDGKKSLKGLNYRRAVLDLTIEGYGNEIVSITDNGSELRSAFLPHFIEGKHHIVITLKPNLRATQRVTIHHNEVILPPTPSVTWNGDTGRIADYLPGADYRLSANGRLSALTDSVFVLPQADGFSEFTVEIAGKYVHGFMSRPYLRFGLTPQVAFFPDSVDGHTTVKISVAEGGDYLLDVGYHPTGSLDVREVSVNTHPMGTLVMTSVNEPKVNGLAYSNMVSVKLLKGTNLIAFRQIGLPKSFTPCEPYHVRIIKQ